MSPWMFFSFGVIRSEEADQLRKYGHAAAEETSIIGITVVNVLARSE